LEVVQLRKITLSFVTVFLAGCEREGHQHALEVFCVDNHFLNVDLNPKVHGIVCGGYFSESVLSWISRRFLFLVREDLIFVFLFSDVYHEFQIQKTKTTYQS
jgi:hypothetical protein